MSLSRRHFIASLAGVAALPTASPLLSGLRKRITSDGKKMIILGMDGVEPSLVERYISEGRLPNFKKFIDQYGLKRLRTTLPPQSPVAWSSFASGMKPGGHGIFDFIHRDPGALIPRLSTSRTIASNKKVSVGSWSIPVSGGSVLPMRQGSAFWDHLAHEGIQSTIFALPANYPIVSGDLQRAMSGMGTPDVLGTYGVFTLFSETPVQGSESFTGGRVVRIKLNNHRADSDLEGPPNEFRNPAVPASIPVIFNRDPWKDTVEIVIDGTSLVMAKGEWSQWVPLRFPLLPMVSSLPGMVRVYVKNVHPRLQVYFSPVNVDPADPCLPITTSPTFSRELAEKVGRFYTQGFPADQKGLAHGVLTDEEYFTQAKIVLDENFALLDYLLKDHREGLLFFYFSSVDQNCHMLWRLCDPSHPMYDPNAPIELRQSVQYFYDRMDEALGKALAHVDDKTCLMVLSDHGFSQFTREFNTNSWLAEAGFLRRNAPVSEDSGSIFSLVDWDNTKVFGLGFNGIYLNLKGREQHGIVDKADAPKVIASVIESLEKVVDPKDGRRIVLKAYDGSVEYGKGQHTEFAPDIVVGFNPGFRTSDDSVLGELPKEIVRDRTDKWAADHCFDPQSVPGIFMTNVATSTPNAAIWDLAPSILQYFGVESPPVDGKSVFKI